MNTIVTVVSGDTLPPLSLLDEAKAVRLDLAVERLREVQALAGIYAAMIEGHAFTVDDLLGADAAFTASTRRAGEALFTLGASLGCEGIA